MCASAFPSGAMWYRATVAATERGRGTKGVVVTVVMFAQVIVSSSDEASLSCGFNSDILVLFLHCVRCLGPHLPFHSFNRESSDGLLRRAA